MPFGITVTGDVFQRKLDQCFGHTKNVIVIGNDIMVSGKKHNHGDHDLALTILPVMYVWIMINSNTRRQKQIIWWNIQLDQQKKPAQTKVYAITSMPEPSYKKQVQSFIGMVNYLSKFFTRLTELAKSIRELAKDKVLLDWWPEHEKVFNLIKKEIAGAPILAYYNTRKQMTLQTDASSKGVGTCLLQRQKPVYFASKALTESQKGHVAIEWESLLVAWAMEKLHHFLYDNHFILETDQKLLETILLKGLNQATPRLQWILIRPFPYHFTVCYIPGPTNQLADCLSRLGTQKDNIKLPKLYLYQITNQLNARSDSLNQLQIATHEDDELALLKDTITQGWSNTIKEVPGEFQAYWTFRESSPLRMA